MTNLNLQATTPNLATIPGLTGTKGGSGVWQRIISEMPAHEVYVEPFWGRGTIARLKLPAKLTIGVDLDPDAISSGSAVADLMFQTDGLRWLKDYFKYSAEQSDVVGSPPGPDARSSDARSGDAGSGVQDLDATFGGVSWRSHFVYLDPPYLGCSGYYRFELTEKQHRELIAVFLSLPCPAALSGYMTDVHDSELKDTRAITIPTVNRAGKRVTEYLWLNFEPPHRYHDTRFVGNGRRERERIRRRVRNWSAGLREMDPAERQAVWEACTAVYRDLAGGADGSDGARSRGVGRVDV